MAGVPHGVTPEQAAEAWTKMATRPSDESGTPRVSEEPVTIATMQAEIRMCKVTIDSREATIKTQEGKLEEAYKQIAELSAKLTVASGVTEAARSIETIVELQRSDLMQRRQIDQLEAENAALRKRLKPEVIAKIHEETFPAPEPTEPNVRLTI